MTSIIQFIPLVGLFVSLGGFIWALSKGQESVQSRLKMAEDEHAELVNKVSDYMERNVKLASSAEEAREHMLESLYQLTTAVRGLDGHNGLTGRTLIIEERFNELQRRVSINEGKMSIWQEMRKFRDNDQS